MGYDMSIAAIAVGMQQQQNAIDLNTAVMKMAMDTSQVAMEDMLEIIDTSKMTGIGGNIDILA